MSNDILTSQQSGEKKQVSTPSRKISSSRLISTFSQFYGNKDEDDAASSSKIVGPVESKILSMWHNVKYGWSGKMKVNFSKEQPVWLLGRCYHRKCSPPSSMTNSVELPTAKNLNIRDTMNEQNLTLPSVDLVPNFDETYVAQELGLDAIEDQMLENSWEEGIEGFKRDFCSRLWMTYRREFPTMNGSNYTSDCGWGCMLRSGQMLLAQGLICHFLGRSWRWDPETQLHNTYEDHIHKKIIRWFGDNSSKNSPFSIHALVNLGQTMGKKPGDWYGPASVAHLLSLYSRHFR